MEHNKKKTSSSSSSSSFTMDLFGPKDSSPFSSSSIGIFGSIFGPPSTGLGKDSSGSGAVRRLEVSMAMRNRESQSTIIVKEREVKMVGNETKTGVELIKMRHQNQVT